MIRGDGLGGLLELELLPKALGGLLLLFIGSILVRMVQVRLLFRRIQKEHGIVSFCLL